MLIYTTHYSESVLVQFVHSPGKFCVISVVQRFCFSLHVTNMKKFYEIDRRERRYVRLVFSLSILYNLLFPKKGEKSVTIVDKRIHNTYTYSKRRLLTSIRSVSEEQYINMKYDETYKNLTACNLTGPKVH